MYALVAQEVVPTNLAEVELDPVGVEVEGDGVRPQALREDALELLKADLSISVQVKELERDLC